MKQRLLRVLNIKASESNYVFDLLSIQLCIGIAHSFINIVSFTFFIHHFAASSIAYAYVVIAGFLLLLNFGYEKLEQRLSPLHLLRTIILLSAIILVCFRGGFLALDNGVMIFALLVWSTLFYMLTGYAYWGLVSLLFNVRESRRVFAIVGAGDVPAKLLGYMAAPVLISLVGIDNLVLLSVTALGIGFYLVNRLIHKKRWKGIGHKLHSASQHTHTGHTGKQSIVAFFLNNKLIFSISLLSLVSYNVFNLIDFTFITQIKAKAQNLTALATYISVFFAVGRVITIVLKLVFTSRVIERLGLITCLMITPATLALFCLFFILNNNSSLALLQFGLMAMLTEVLRSAMQEPVFFILFQPLSSHNRLKGHIIAKGYMLAPSLLIVGASLVLFHRLGVELTIETTTKILLANLLVWVAVIYFIRNAYTNTLHHSIAKGVMNSEGLVVFDQRTFDVLLERVTTGNLSEKIYALKLLENGNHPRIGELLEEQLLAMDLSLKKYAFGRLEERGMLSSSVLEQMIAADPHEELQEMAIIALCKIQPASLQYYMQGLAGRSPSLQKGLILLLLEQKEFTRFYTGATAIQQLLQSCRAADRQLALDIISHCRAVDFTDTIVSLLDDSEPSVKRNAFVIACKLRKSSLLPVILKKLQNREDKYLAIQGLFQYGEGLFEDLELLPPELVETCMSELRKIAAKQKGPIVTQFLLNQLRRQKANMYTNRVIQGLWSRNFQAETVEDIHLFKALLHRFIKNGIKKIGFVNSVPHWKGRHLLQRSLEAEIWSDLTLALQICVILYPKKEINRIIELTENKEQHKLYNGMEMLEMTLPKKIAGELNDLFDFLFDPIVKKKHVLAQSEQHFFSDIVLRDRYGFNDCTRSVCVYST
ncbi:MAG TPA: MFS transporter, partial [Flavisolibacter sp.]|nr:MFS transporter [Flavisolibacter sp.]